MQRETPVFVPLGQHLNRKELHSQYLNNLFRTIAKRAGIRKHIYPLLFRHTKATQLFADPNFTEQLVKKHQGWTKDSSMPRIYEHLDKEALIRAIAPESAESEERKEPITCRRCGSENEPNASSCVRCSLVLDDASARQILDREERIEAELRELREKVEERDRIIDRLMRFMEKAEKSETKEGNGDSNNPGIFG